MRNRPAALLKAVATIWRTKLGTTPDIGFNSTTEISARLRRLGGVPVCFNRRSNQVTFRYGPASPKQSLTGAGA